MGLFDKVKDAAAKAKDKLDGTVKKNSDKNPNQAEKADGKASDTAGKVIPGNESEKAPHEKRMEGGA